MDSELKKLCKMDSTSDIIGDMEQIINRSRNIAYLYVNRALVLRNWLIGRRIDQEILKDQSFEDNYGKKLIVDLSRKLTSEYGKGFSPSTLYKYVRFYKLFPKILSTVWTQSFSCLSWSHYRLYRLHPIHFSTKGSKTFRNRGCKIYIDTRGLSTH